MSRICLALTGKTLARDLEILGKYRRYVDVAELRVDCLDPDERFLIRRFPEMAGLPVILTVRRVADGGFFSGGEGVRMLILAKGLAFAEADRRRNFSYVDLEEDVRAPSLEEVSRAFGTKIIRSYHNIQSVDSNLVEKIRGLRRFGDEIAKVAVTPRSLDDVRRIYRAAAETKDVDKILFSMGRFGANTRILAERLGSYLSYCSAKGESDLPELSPGQLDPAELSELFHFKSINRHTKIFAVTGFPLKVASSPNFFNAVFSSEKIDAVFIPLPADSIEQAIRLADDIGIAGIFVTVPYKEKVLQFLSWHSDRVKAIRACNTLVSGEQGWMGYNTDTQGFSDSLLEFASLKDLKRKKITIIGAGGMARAVAAEVSRLNGKALILNRTATKAREVAVPYGFAWGGLESQDIKMMEKYTDIIIQATTVGMEPDIEADPVHFYKFTGREFVMDLIYKPAKTRCLERAEAAGCKIINGYDMLLRQARYQYKYFIGKEFPPSLINRVGF